MKRSKSIFDVRDRPYVTLADGVYDGMALHNLPLDAAGSVTIKEVRIPCKTAESGVTVQVYRDDSETFRWSHYEQPDEPAVAEVFGEETMFVAILVAEMGNDKPTTNGKQYLIEGGQWLHRIRLLGTKHARIVMLTDRASYPYVKRLTDAYGAEVFAVDLPESPHGFKWRCLGLKAHLFQALDDLGLVDEKRANRLVIFSDIDLTPLRPAPDFKAALLEALTRSCFVTAPDKNPNMFTCLTNEKTYPFTVFGPGPMLRMATHLGDKQAADQEVKLSAVPHLNTSFFAFHLNDPRVPVFFKSWSQGWGMEKTCDELGLAWSEILNGVQFRPATLDVRYNRYIMSVFHRYQLGLERDNLWLDDVCGLQGHLAVHEIGGGVGYRDRVKEVLGL